MTAAAAGEVMTAGLAAVASDLRAETSVASVGKSGGVVTEFRPPAVTLPCPSHITVGKTVIEAFNLLACAMKAAGENAGMNDLDSSLLAVVEAYKAAVFTKDVAAFVSLYDPNVRIFDTWGKWSYEGIDGWRQMAVGWFGSLGLERVRVEAADLKGFKTPELAMVNGFFIYTGVSAEGTTLRSMSNRLTWVLKPQGGPWKIVHEHTSVPIALETTQAILKR